MNKEICSYCQRQYGTLSLNNGPIYRTFDHIVPLLRKRGSNGVKNRQGAMCKGANITTKEINNLLQCCNECNLLKGKKTIEEFKNGLNNLSKKLLKHNPNHWLTSNMVLTIKTSIVIIQNSKTEPLLLDIMIENQFINILKIN